MKTAKATKKMITAPFARSLGLYSQYSQVTEVDKCVFWQVRADNTGNNPKKENKHETWAHFSVS